MNGKEFLLATGVYANNNKGTKLVLLATQTTVNAVRPDIDLMKELKVRLMERMLGAELTEHLGYEPHAEPSSQQSNRRNGSTRKVLKGQDGTVPIDIPRDRPSR